MRCGYGPAGSGGSEGDLGRRGGRGTEPWGVGGVRRQTPTPNVSRFQQTHRCKAVQSVVRAAWGLKAWVLGRPSLSNLQV